MSVAKLKRVNTALGQLGQELVADLGESSRENSGALVKLLLVADEARDAVLSRHGWVEALEYLTVQPASLPGYSNFRYPGVYVLPSDALRVWEIEGQCEPDWGPRWQAGALSDGRRIIRSTSATAPLNVVYVKRAHWDAIGSAVGDAIAFDMAARACFSITGDDGLADGLAKKAEAKVLLAISLDSTQEGNQPPLAPSTPEQIRRLAR